MRSRSGSPTKERAETVGGSSSSTADPVMQKRTGWCCVAVHREDSLLALTSDALVLYDFNSLKKTAIRTL